jgi:hypothetical protein
MGWFIAWLSLARIIAGEAGVCDIDGRLAVAHVHQNRIAAGMPGGWYGDDVPSPVDLAIAMNYRSMDDPTDGALYLFSRTDAQLEQVREIIGGQEPTAQFYCERGLILGAYR